MEPRTISCVGRGAGAASDVDPWGTARSACAAFSPFLREGCRIVVKSSAAAVGAASSKPTRDRSAGTRRSSLGRAERTLCEPVAETEEGGRAGDLREGSRRAGFAFLRCAVGALVDGHGIPVQTVPIGSVPVAGEAIARHGVSGRALCRDINQTSDRAAMQAETHDSDPAMSKLEHVIGRLGSSKPVGYPDPRNMWREAIELGWAGLVDDHQRQPAYGCHFQDRIIVGQRCGDEAIHDSSTDGRSPRLTGRGTRQEEQPDTCRLDDARDTGKELTGHRIIECIGQSVGVYDADCAHLPPSQASGQGSGPGYPRRAAVAKIRPRRSEESWSGGYRRLRRSSPIPRVRPPHRATSTAERKVTWPKCPTSSMK